MKNTVIKHAVLGLFALVMSSSLVAKPSSKINIVKEASKSSQIKAMEGLVERRLPALKDNFVFGMIAKEDGRNVFEVSTKADKIYIKGSTGVSMAVGLNWYLRHVCDKQISWCGNNLSMGKSDIKSVPGGVFRNVIPHKNNVYLNYCTLSYSMAWWDWERWQWEIDFMALNGITMPLSVVGIEAVWYNAMMRVGLSDLEARKFLVAPNYFAWQWMQNIENDGEPLPKAWIDSHIVLGKQILDRQRSFGMTPIQQGFSGHIPSVFKTKFPTARIRQQPKWCNFPGVCQLDPLDSLFTRFGKIFMEEEAKLFGLGGYYAADPFHESAPPSDIPAAEMPKYLNQVGKTIHEVFNAIDKNSIWVMQSWSIRKEIATAAPKKRLLVIDLEGVKWKETKGFWGHDFCVGQLHNFGNRINLHGDLRYLASNPFVNAQKQYPQTAVGTGLFPEGIIQNPVFYDCYFDVIWRSDSINLDEWLKSYQIRRYGQLMSNTAQAWELLKNGPYKAGTNGVEASSIVAARPALNCKKSGPNRGFEMPYEKKDLVKAWQLLLADQAALASMEGYQFDVMDVGRQSMSNLAQDIHKDIRTAFETKNVALFNQKTKEFIDLLNDIDKLCDTRSEYQFSKWLNDSKRWAGSDSERKYYDFYASRLLSYWGPDKTPIIFDYSWREWSGLIASYYVPRWQKFFDFLSVKLANNEEYSEKGLKQAHGREAWRANEFYTDLAKWEENWVSTPKDIQSKPYLPTDAVSTSQAMYLKWSGLMEKYYSK